jgi:hypothetical protein
MWLVLAFSALGLLIGNLVGLSATSVVTPLLGLLFAFGGSSVIAFLHKLRVDDRKVAAQAIFAISVACVIGVYMGVLVNQYRVLSPKDRRWPPLGSAAGNKGDSTQIGRWMYDPYVRSAIGKKADEIDARYRNGELSAPAAYDSLYSAVKQAADSAP